MPLGGPVGTMVEIIQALIPLGLMRVEEGLNYVVELVSYKLKE